MKQYYDKDLVWINKNTKTEIKEKNTFYQKHFENRRLESDMTSFLLKN